MKCCPYRKQVRISYDGAIRVTQVDFMECVKEVCPFWGTIAISADDYEWICGCRKAKKECS